MRLSERRSRARVRQPGLQSTVAGRSRATSDASRIRHAGDRAHRSHTGDRASDENPRIPGQGNPPQVRRADAARRPAASASTRRSPAARSLGGPVWVVKAQIHAGGRGKGGGVKLARVARRGARSSPAQILGMQLVTHQTGPEGQKVRRLLIEEGADIRKELYVGMVVDRATQRVVLMAIVRRRHGHRGSRRAHAGEDPQGRSSIR